MLLALGYAGFLLNLINLIPIGFLDGGAVARAALDAWRLPVIHYENGVPMRAGQPDRARAVAIGILYALLVVALVYGMAKAHVPQNRL